MPQSKQRRTAKILRVSRAIYIYSQYSDNLWNDRLSRAHSLSSLFKPPETEGSDTSHGKSYKRSRADNLGWCDEHPWLYPDGYTGPIQGPWSVYVCLDRGNGLHNDRLKFMRDHLLLLERPGAGRSDDLGMKAYRKSWADNRRWCDQHPEWCPDDYAGLTRDP